MGLDVSVLMVCGVKASDIFPQGYRKESRQIQTVNALGKPTGRTKTLKEWYLDCSAGSFLVGNNESALTDAYSSDRVEVGMSAIFGESDADDEACDSDYDWIHASDWNSNKLEQFVIGLEIDPVEHLTSSGESDLNYKFQTTIPEQLVSRVRQELSTRFGYQGEIYTIAVVHYSY